MDGAGLLELSQVSALLMDIVPPEAKVRQFQMGRGRLGGQNTSVPVQMARGMREIVRTKLRRLILDGKVKKHGSGKEAKYEWVGKAKASTDRQDSAGR
jgi:hypothetical protein